jgi:hypothetical protein
MSKKLEINLDATALAHSGCILDLYRTVIGSINEQGDATGGYKERAYNASLVYGIALHKFVDVMFKTGGLYPKARAKAIELFNLPKNDDKKQWLLDERHFTTVCFNLWSSYVEQEQTYDPIELLQDCYLCRGKGIVEWDSKAGTIGSAECPHCKGQKQLLAPATEITFRIKYFEDDHVIIYLCGTIDTIGKFRSGCYSIRDWKTTASWDNEGYFQQYELSRQLRVYLLAIKLMTQMHPDSVLGKIGATQLGCFIDAVFLTKNPNEVTFKRSEVYQIKPKDLDAFQMTLDDKCHELSAAVKTGYIPKEGIINGHCIKYQQATEKNFVKCAFWDICRNSDEVGAILLKRNFMQRPFNPLTYNEV